MKNKTFNDLRKNLKLREKIIKENTEKKVNMAMLKVRSEVQEVIGDYNKGKIERYAEDFEERAEREEKKVTSKSNMPLIDTSFLRSNLPIKVEHSKNIVTGTLSFGAEYAKYLNDGTENIRAYRFKEIALARAKNDLKKILK